MDTIGGPTTSLAWGVLACLLLVTSVGLSGVLNLLGSLLLIILTTILVFLLTNFAYSTVDQRWRCVRVRSKHGRLPRRVVDCSKTIRQTVMTGSPATDKPLQDMISFIIRDFVSSWYRNISSNPTFPDELGAILCLVVTLITERIYVVDWVPFLTREIYLGLRLSLVLATTIMRSHWSRCLCHKEPAQGTQRPLLGAFLAFRWFFIA